jgi:hypothetical protein
MAGAAESEAGCLIAADPDTPRRFEKLAARPLAQDQGKARPDMMPGASRLRLFEQTWSRRVG